MLLLYPIQNEILVWSRSTRKLWGFKLNVHVQLQDSETSTNVRGAVVARKCLSQ